MKTRREFVRHLGTGAIGVGLGAAGFVAGSASKSEPVTAPLGDSRYWMIVRRPDNVAHLYAIDNATGERVHVNTLLEYHSRREFKDHRWSWEIVKIR